MRIAVLGTGMVGATLATGLLRLGHDVTMGSREATSDGLTAWVSGLPADLAPQATAATFAIAAETCELVINATAGTASIAALATVDPASLAGKVLIDVSNPLDFSHGFPPRLTVCNDDSLGEQIQRAFPQTHVVKALNTVNCAVMTDPGRVPGDHCLFIAGNDADAKSQTLELLAAFGWPAQRVHDVGDISGARATEMYLPLWLRLMGSVGTADFNIGVMVQP